MVILGFDAINTIMENQNRLHSNDFYPYLVWGHNNPSKHFIVRRIGFEDGK